jgi:hypothetical protein
LEKLKTQSTDKALLLLFWAEWHEPSHLIKDMLLSMPNTYTNLKFAWCDSDTATEIVDKLNVNEVPSIAMFHPHKLNAEILENPSPAFFSETVTAQNEFYQKWFEQEK